MLSSEVAPQIIEVLEVRKDHCTANVKVKEQERLKQEAINNRKRSSRIAMRELEREEQQKQEQAQREMEERMERLRQEEARKEREEQEVLARERAREERLREREERLAARERAIHERAESEARQREQAERARERRKRRREGEDVSDDDETTPPSRAATSAPSESQGSWELKCEVCKLHGWNLNDETDVVCCDDCGRWQHVPCHDRQDKAAGRQPRDWDSVDFRVGGWIATTLTVKCQECEQRASAAKRPKTEHTEEAPPQAATARPANGHPADVKALLNAAPAHNDPRHSDPQVAQPQRFSNGYAEAQSGHLLNGPQQHQQLPRGHGVPLPPLSHPHVSPQGLTHHLPSPPMYALPPDRQAQAGYRPPYPPVQAHDGYYRNYPHAQYANGPAPHHAPPLHSDGRPSFPHQPQHYGQYAGAPYTGPPRYPVQHSSPVRVAPDAQGRYPVPSPERRLYGDNRSS